MYCCTHDLGTAVCPGPTKTTSEKCHRETDSHLIQREERGGGGTGGTDRAATPTQLAEVYASDEVEGESPPAPNSGTGQRFSLSCIPKQG
jgi:hypothetical protein